MLSFLSGDLLTAIVRLLPRAFMFGTPIALSLMMVAAFVDVKVPYEVDVTWRR
jgi:hypothetical protein